jgi:glycine hydroxymethyltransferase
METTDVAGLENVIRIRNLSKKHNEYYSNSISLIASDNIISPLAKEMLISDFGSRYGEGHPGSFYIYETENIVNSLAKRLFRSHFIDTRPISGTNSNQAVVFALANPGDIITSPSIKDGAHISSTEQGTIGFRGLKSVVLPFDVDTMNIDIDHSSKLIRSVKPKLALFGQSVFLFPAPLKELYDSLQEARSYVWYDGAHVLGLIAGKSFQDPLKEGAQVITGSTHKTLPGPQRGIIVGNTNYGEIWDKIDRAVYPGVLANYHLNTLAALGVTFAEFLEFGEKYANQVIRNARKLAENLHESGFKVLGEKVGFTSSHTIWIDVKMNGGGLKVSKSLEEANIFVNPYPLPYDKDSDEGNVGGIRLGVQEITRMGMTEPEMLLIGDLISRLILKKDDPVKIKQDVVELKSRFKYLQYCFTKNYDPFKYIELEANNTKTSEVDARKSPRKD